MKNSDEMAALKTVIAIQLASGVTIRGLCKSLLNVIRSDYGWTQRCVVWTGSDLKRHVTFKWGTIGRSKNVLEFVQLLYS